MMTSFGACRDTSASANQTIILRSLLASLLLSVFHDAILRCGALWQSAVLGIAVIQPNLDREPAQEDDNSDDIHYFPTGPLHREGRDGIVEHGYNCIYER